MGKLQLGIVSRSSLVEVGLEWLRLHRVQHLHHRMDSLDKPEGLLRLDICHHQLHQPNGWRLGCMLEGYSMIVLAPMMAAGSMMVQELDSIGSIEVVGLGSIVVVEVDSTVVEVGVVVVPTWPEGCATKHYHKLEIQGKQRDQHRLDIGQLVDVDLRSIQSRIGMPVNKHFSVTLFSFTHYIFFN